MRHHKILITCLLSLVCTAMQAQQREARILAEGSSLRPIPKAEKSQNCIEWHSTENRHSKDTTIFWVSDIDTVTFTEKAVAYNKRTMESGYVSLDWQLTEEAGRTVMHCHFQMPADSVTNVWLASEETAIIDRETGIQYRAQSATPGCWKRYFGIISSAGATVDFKIYFPPLPDNVKRIAIYGIPAWELRGDNITLRKRQDNETAYDTVPKFRIPHLVSPAQNYDKDNSRSWAVYTDAHLIKPVEENTIAIWRTPDATYLAMAKEQNWMREYYGIEEETCLIDCKTGRSYKIRSMQNLPLGQTFWIEGYSGDYQAFVMEFEPLPLEATSITYFSPEGKPFKAWGANWEAACYQNLDVEILRANQPLFEYHEREIAE